MRATKSYSLSTATLEGTNRWRALLLVLLPALLWASAADAYEATTAGIEAFHRGQYSLAISYLKNAADERGHVFYGLSLAGAGRCEQAIPVLSKPIDDASLRRLGGLALVKCYQSLDQMASAAKALDPLQREFPSDADVLYLSAKLHMKAFNDATAAMFQKVPDSYRVHQLSAEIFEIEGRYSEAAGEYRKAIEVNPHAPDLHFRLGRAILLQAHDAPALDQAAAQFREELKLSPEDAACFFQLGQIASVRGDTSAARTAFSKAIELSPAFAQALVALARIDLKEKKPAEAIARLRRAVEAQPDNESAHYALMTAYRDAGDMENAKGEKAILDRLTKPPEGEFTRFLQRLGEKSPQ